MNCEHNDCFSCPYPDCVISESVACYSPEKRKERIRKQKEYNRKRDLRLKATKELMNGESND